MKPKPSVELQLVARSAPTVADVGAPLYRRIADDLLIAIQQGKYPVGSLLPTELTLATQLHASRGSVRGALQLLADWGMIERTRKTGTRVLRLAPLSGYVQRMNGLGETLGFAGDTVMRIDDMRDVADPAEPGLVGETSATGYWLQITGARHLPSSPDMLNWTRVFVNGPLSGIRPLIRPEMESIYRVIEQAYGLRVSRLRQKVTARALPDDAAGVLDLPRGAPVLEVQAWLHGADGQLIEFVRSIHDPSRYAIEISAQSSA